MKQAVFLDRDGVINAPPAPPKRYITRWQEFHFLPGSLAALRQLKESGCKVIILSNQAGVGRRIYSAAHLREITRKMLRKIRSSGGGVDAIYYCTHTPEAGCGCRKPRPELLLRGARRFCIDPRRSFLIGDNATDIQMGKGAGCRTVLVLSGATSRGRARRMTPRPDHTARDLRTAVRWILHRSPGQAGRAGISARGRAGGALSGGRAGTVRRRASTQARARPDAGARRAALGRVEWCEPAHPEAGSPARPGSPRM